MATKQGVEQAAGRRRGSRSPDSTGDQQAGSRRADGRFRAGVSGNPAGRPKGSRNRITAECLELLGDESGAVMATLVRRAKRGDGVALRLCVERLVPIKAARDRVVELELPAIGKASDLVGAAAAVIERTAAGELTVSEAREFLQLLEYERKAIETAELAVRIEALESAAPAKGPVGFAPGGDDVELAARVRRLEE